MPISVILVTILSCYFLGNHNGAICVSHMLHDDVREHGSGNAGLTNFIRNYGANRSILVILIDVLKAVLACWLGRVLFTPPCQHWILFASSPVSAGSRKKFICFNTFYAHKVWTCTEVNPFTLFVEGNLGTFWKILNQLYFVRLVLFLEEFDCFFSWHCIFLNLGTFFDDFFHLFFDCIQIIS